MKFDKAINDIVGGCIYNNWCNIFNSLYDECSAKPISFNNKTWIIALFFFDEFTVCFHLFFIPDAYDCAEHWNDTTWIFS